MYIISFKDTYELRYRRRLCQTGRECENGERRAKISFGDVTSLLSVAGSAGQAARRMCAVSFTSKLGVRMMAHSYDV